MQKHRRNPSLKIERDFFLSTDDKVTLNEREGMISFWKSVEIS